jgi:hypothetical protein
LFVRLVKCADRGQRLPEIAILLILECIKIRLDRVHVNSVPLVTDVMEHQYSCAVKISIVHLEIWIAFNVLVAHSLDFIMHHLYQIARNALLENIVFKMQQAE